MKFIAELVNISSLCLQGLGFWSHVFNRKVLLVWQIAGGTAPCGPKKLSSWSEQLHNSDGCLPQLPESSG